MTQEKFGKLTSVPPTAEQEALASYSKAYASITEDLQQVTEGQLIPITLDLTGVMGVVIGNLPEILATREEVAENLSNFDLSLYDKLELYARALGHAEALYLGSTQSKDAVAELAQAAAKKREVLLSDARALVKRELLDGSALEQLKGGVGYEAIGVDLMVLRTVLGAALPALGNKTPVTRAELAEAEGMANQLLTSLARREQGPKVTAEATDTRRRAFSLCVRTYDEIRRAIHFLRWQRGDADQIAPSLYAGRRRKSAAGTPPPSDVAEGNALALSAEPSSGARTPGASDLIAGGGASAVRAASNAVPAGLPGASPFTA